MSAVNNLLTYLKHGLVRSRRVCVGGVIIVHYIVRRGASVAGTFGFLVVLEGSRRGRGGGSGRIAVHLRVRVGVDVLIHSGRLVVLDGSVGDGG